MRAPPVNWWCAITRMRRIILRRISIAGGTTITLNSDITGSWTAITPTSAISERKSRPIDVISRLRTLLAAAAPVVRRAMNSELWRWAKKPMFCCSRAVNIRRWFSATIRLPIRARVSAPP